MRRMQAIRTRLAKVARTLAPPAPYIVVLPDSFPDQSVFDAPHVYRASERPSWHRGEAVYGPAHA